MPILVQYPRRHGKTMLAKTMRRTDCNLQSFVTLDTPRVSDVELECWGNFYVANKLHARGVLFTAFMRNPRRFAESVVFRRPMPLPKGEEFYPLLPKQLEAAMRIDRHNRPRRRAISREVS